MKRIQKYKFNFILSFIFHAIGFILVQILPNPLPTLILFGYFFLYYLGAGISHFIKQRENQTHL